jgi:hypothetical protein
MVSSIAFSLGSNTFDELQESIGVCTDKLAVLLAVRKGHKGGHGADGQLLAEFGHFIDVELDEVNLLELLVVRKLWLVAES